MRRAERVVFALTPLREARQPAALTQRRDPVLATRQNLMRITLVTDVPNQDVARGVKNVMDRRRQLDNAQTRTQMTPRLRDRLDRRHTQLVRQLTHVALRQLTQIRRHVYTVQ